MRLEVNSAIEKPVKEIASQAARIADHVQRLRYLRERVELAPARTWWTLRSPEAVAIGLTAIFIGIAVLVWILT